MRTPKAFVSVVVMSLVAAAVITTPSHGQSASSIFDQLNKYKGDERAIETKISGTEEDTAVKQKQIRYWKRFARTELKAQAAPIQKRIDEYNAEVRRGEAARHSYNNRCAGKSLSRAGKARCDGEYDQLISWKRRLAAKEKRLAKDKRDLREKGANIHKKVEQLTSKIARNESRSRNLKSQLESVSRTIRQLEAKAKRICESRQNICEIIHHCASMNWDGTRPNLPLGEVTRCR